MPPLANKVALVTGASRGIGAAITYASSPDRADQVVAAIRAAGGTALALRADSADPAAVQAAVRQTVEQLGGLDILVNNAGVFTGGQIADVTDEQFERMLAVNVRGVFYAAREAARVMRDGGRIINIGSVNSDAMPFPGGSVYALTKGAVAAFTRGLARDLGPRRITVNNVQPGPVDTDLNPANGPSADMLKGFMAIKRFGHGDEIAALVAYLAGPQGGYVTGAGLKIDGGFDA